MELKVKEFCFFDCLEVLFFNVLFQNNYFKKHFTENKVHACMQRVHMFEVSVFVALFTEFLLICVTDYGRKIKQDSHSL